MRRLETGITDQTIVIHCFDSDEAAVTLTSESAALAMSYRLDTAGREGTPVSMTPVPRLSAGVHRDGAITSKGSGKHEIDLPDAAFASVGYLTVILSATSVTGRVYSEVIAVGEAAVLNAAYLFDDGAGRLAIKANITHYQGTLQGNGDLPAKMDAVYNRIGAPVGDSIAGDIAAISDMRSIIAEWIALNIPSDVRGFPATIIGGTDVAIPIEIVDSNNDPITEIFDESVETVEWLFGMGTSARRARILGSAEWTSDDLLLISIAKADTLSEDDGPRTWMIGVKLTSGELKWVKTGVTRLIGRQFAEPTTTTTGA